MAAAVLCWTLILGVECSLAQAGPRDADVLNPPGRDAADARFDATFPFTWIDMALVAGVAGFYVMSIVLIRLWVRSASKRAQQPPHAEDRFRRVRAS